MNKQYIEVCDHLGMVVGSCKRHDLKKAVALLQTAGVVCTGAYHIVNGQDRAWFPIELETSPSVKEVTAAMRRGVQRGLNFYQWRKNLTMSPRLYSEQEMQLYYEKLEATFAPKTPEGEGQFVLLKVGGAADRKQNKFMCFQTKVDAGKEGRKLYGYGNFEIADWQKYKKTEDFRAMQRYFKFKAKFSRFK